MLVWAYAKDPGGTAGILPVVQELRRDGHEVVLFAEGVAKERCEAFGYVAEASLSGALAMPRPQLFLTSMCSGGGLGRDLVPHLRGSCTIVALQDYWGARLATDWAGVEYRPDYIVVNDDVGADIVARTWHDGARVIVSTYPALDRFAGLDVVGVKQRVAEHLGLVPGIPVIFFAGQVRGTGRVLCETISALRLLDRPLYFMPRAHPRLATDSPDDATQWADGMASVPDAWMMHVFNDLVHEEALALADVVVASFSTVLVEAAAIRKPAVAALMPESGMKNFRETTGFIMDENPLVSLGCALKAATAADLAGHIATCVKSPTILRNAQEKAFTVDGRNAERLANVLVALPSRRG